MVNEVDLRRMIVNSATSRLRTDIPMLLFLNNRDCGGD